VADEPWLCSGETDHIGRCVSATPCFRRRRVQGRAGRAAHMGALRRRIGTRDTCPSKEEVDAKRAARQSAREAGRIEAPKGGGGGAVAAGMGREKARAEWERQLQQRQEEELARLGAPAGVAGAAGAADAAGAGGEGGTVGAGGGVGGKVPAELAAEIERRAADAVGPAAAEATAAAAAT
jgi:hypothetical protein